MKFLPAYDHQSVLLPDEKFTALGQIRIGLPLSRHEGAKPMAQLAKPARILGSETEPEGLSHRMWNKAVEVVSPQLERLLFLCKILPPVVDSTDTHLFMVQDTLDDLRSNKRPEVLI